MFEPGNPGKPKGAIHKRSKHFLEVLEKHNFCAATALIECYIEAKKTYDNYGTIYDAISDARTDKNHESGQFAAPTEDNGHKYLKIAADIAKDLASYSYPKLKAMEQNKKSPLDDMTPEQQLEAMKHMVAMLEHKVKSGS